MKVSDILGESISTADAAAVYHRDYMATRDKPYRKRNRKNTSKNTSGTKKATNEGVIDWAKQKRTDHLAAQLDAAIAQLVSHVRDAMKHRTKYKPTSQKPATPATPATAPAPAPVPVPAPTNNAPAMPMLNLASYDVEGELVEGARTHNVMKVASDSLRASNPQSPLITKTLMALKRGAEVERIGHTRTEITKLVKKINDLSTRLGVPVADLKQKVKALRAGATVQDRVSLMMGW